VERRSAKNGGDVKRDHFADQPDEVTANCGTAGETALHILDKETVATRHGQTARPTAPHISEQFAKHLTLQRFFPSILAYQWFAELVTSRRVFRSKRISSLWTKRPAEYQV